MKPRFDAGSCFSHRAAVRALARSRAGGSFSIRATNVFRKEGGTWRMIGHHTDLLEQLAP